MQHYACCESWVPPPAPRTPSPAVNLALCRLLLCRSVRGYPTPNHGPIAARHDNHTSFPVPPLPHSYREKCSFIIVQYSNFFPPQLQALIDITARPAGPSPCLTPSPTKPLVPPPRLPFPAPRVQLQAIAHHTHITCSPGHVTPPPSPAPLPPQVQLQALIDAFFRDLQAANPDDQMQFNIAVSVMLIQRRWRTRMRAARLRNKKIWRALRRTGIPTYKVGRPTVSDSTLCAVALHTRHRTQRPTALPTSSARAQHRDRCWTCASDAGKQLRLSS